MTHYYSIRNFNVPNNVLLCACLQQMITILWDKGHMQSGPSRCKKMFTIFFSFIICFYIISYETNFTKYIIKWMLLYILLIQILLVKSLEYKSQYKLLKFSICVHATKVSRNLNFIFTPYNNIVQLFRYFFVTTNNHEPALRISCIVKR